MVINQIRNDKLNALVGPDFKKTLVDHISNKKYYMYDNNTGVIYMCEGKDGDDAFGIAVMHGNKGFAYDKYNITLSKIKEHVKSKRIDLFYTYNIGKFIGRAILDSKSK